MRLYEILTIDPRKILSMEYWRLVGKQPGLEIWRHMDDPEIGEYRLSLGQDNTVTRVDYTTPLHPMFSRSFTSFREFLNHIRTITDDSEPEDIEKGHERLRGIADKLRKNRDGNPNI